MKTAYTDIPITSDETLVAAAIEEFLGRARRLHGYGQKPGGMLWEAANHIESAARFLHYRGLEGHEHCATCNGDGCYKCNYCGYAWPPRGSATCDG